MAIINNLLNHITTMVSHGAQGVTSDLHTTAGQASNLAVNPFMPTSESSTTTGGSLPLQNSTAVVPAHTPTTNSVSNIIVYAQKPRS